MRLHPALASSQDTFGVNVCTLMSMMSTKTMPSACETDITGLLSMYALELAAEESTGHRRSQQQLRR